MIKGSYYRLEAAPEVKQWHRIDDFQQKQEIKMNISLIKNKWMQVMT